MPRLKTRLPLLVVTLWLVIPYLTACSTFTSRSQVSAAAGESWIVLPVNNLSNTPLAGESAVSMIETRLRSRGVQQLAVYQPTEKLTLASVLSTTNDLSAAKVWAKERGYRYAITGTVHEWQYKNGTDKEPVVGMSLKLFELGLTGGVDKVIWQASAAKTGWGFANLSGVADVVIQKLLKQVNINAGH